MIELNHKYEALFKNNTRFFIVTGGRGSSKSFGVGTFSTMLSFEPTHKILFTRQTMTSANLSIIKGLRHLQVIKPQTLNPYKVFQLGY